MNQHIPRKRFGQNFLHDKSYIERIINSLNIPESESIVEIGPGQGALTYPLLQQYKKLAVIELDRDLLSNLEQQGKEYGDLQIYNEDALKFDFHKLNTNSLHIIGNLPYNISTPILFHLFQHLDLIASMTFMLQKEVVDRLAADVNDSNFSRLSVMAQYYCDVEKLFDVPPGAFFPPPKVMSSVVSLRPKEQSSSLEEQTLFSKIVKQAFSQRRKVLKTNLKQWLSIEDFTTLDINPSCRAQELSVEDYIVITNYVKSNSLTE